MDPLDHILDEMRIMKQGRKLLFYDPKTSQQFVVMHKETYDKIESTPAAFEDIVREFDERHQRRMRCGIVDRIFRLC